MGAYARAIVALDLSVFAVSFLAFMTFEFGWINAMTFACLIVSVVNIGLSIANVARIK